MPAGRLFLTCPCVSVLLHLLVLWLVYRFPSTVHRPEEVMEIDLSDIPRATDFLPPEPGLLEGRPPPPVRPQPSREARKEPPAPRVLEGRVPDLPVTPGPPPEEPSGGRGQGAASGNAVGTGGATTGKVGITEEGGGGFRLTPLNAPEVQYISYFASIKRKIELVWQYPYEAAVAGIGGELILDFVIARSGAVDSIELVRGSGSKVLDDEAIRSIRTAAPFDPIPVDYKIPKLQIRGRFVYVHGGALRLR